MCACSFGGKCFHFANNNQKHMNVSRAEKHRHVEEARSCHLSTQGAACRPPGDPAPSLLPAPNSPRGLDHSLPCAFPRLINLLRASSVSLKFSSFPVLIDIQLLDNMTPHFQRPHWGRSDSGCWLPSSPHFPGARMGANQLLKVEDTQRPDRRDASHQKLILRLPESYYCRSIARIQIRINI